MITYFKRLLVGLNSSFVKTLLKLKGAKFSGAVKIKGIPYCKNKGTFTLGGGVCINSRYASNPIGGQSFCSFFIGEGASMRIGDGSGVSNSAFFCSTKIVVGKNVKIGGNCFIYDTDFHSIHLEDRIASPERNIKTASVIISDGVFIGGGTTILKGVNIGENAVIGAGSVVAKDIPANEIWAGNPVRFIKKID